MSLVRNNEYLSFLFSTESPLSNSWLLNQPKQLYSMLFKNTSGFSFICFYRPHHTQGKAIFAYWLYVNLASGHQGTER